MKLVLRNIDTFLLNIPENPGVYFFFNSKNQIIYIGKAKNLKNRVRQYFRQNDSRYLIPLLVEETVKIDFIITRNEETALILENEQIKKYKPKYNIDLKDDKTYPFIAITNEKFPRIVLTRNLNKNYKYIKGPFSSAIQLKNTIKALNSFFMLKTCKKMPKTACLNKQLGICLAPCENKEIEKTYKKKIQNLIEILNGKKWNDFVAKIEKEIETSASKLMFEKAGYLRDVLKMLPKLKSSLKISKNNTTDYFFFEFLDKTFFLTIKTKNNQNEEIYQYKKRYFDKNSTVIESISSFYETANLPQTIKLYPFNSTIKNQIELLLKIKTAEIEEKEKIILKSNQATLISSFLKNSLDLNNAIKEIETFTNSKARKIACIDISTFYGENTVAGYIFWETGEFKKKNYRRIKIKTFEGQNDFEALFEAVSRINKHWEKKEWEKPDLFLIDGGKGQISAVKKALKNQNIAGIIKDRKKIKGKEIMINENGEIKELHNDFTALLLKKIRDEAHRFVITYNRNLRKTETKLGKIKGIGEKKEKMLLKFFTTYENIKNAPTEEIASIPGFSQTLAKKIKTELNSF